MKTANEARSIAVDAINEKYNEALRLISAAAREGKFTIYYDRATAHPTVLQMLREHEFKVAIAKSGAGSISW